MLDKKRIIISSIRDGKSIMAIVREAGFSRRTTKKKVEIERK